MFRVRKNRKHGGSDRRSEADTEKSGTKSLAGPDQGESGKTEGSEPKGSQQADLTYVVALLERIAYQTYTGNLSMPGYLDQVKSSCLSKMRDTG